MGSVNKNKDGSNIDKDKEIYENEKQFIMHGADGPFLMDKNKWPKLNQIVEQDSQEQEGFGVLTQEDSSIQTSITLDNIAGGLSQPKANDSLAPGKEATEVNT
jgi:hypothetical protein